MSEILIIKSEKGYQCPYCKRDFKEKFNIVNHTTTCRFLSLTKREQDNEIEQKGEDLPTQYELFRIIQHLSLRIDKLENENSKIKKQNMKKVNVIDWLNQSEKKPKYLFKEWVSCYVLPKIVNHVEIAYKNNLTDSIYDMFENIVKEGGCIDIHPFCCFDHKSSVFYVYRTDSSGISQWEQLINEEFDQFIKQIVAKYYGEFLKGWYAEHESMILENETYYETYIRYYKKISAEVNYSKVKQRLYFICKQHMSS